MFNSEKRLVFKKKSGPSESGGGKRNRSEDVAAMLKALGADSDKKREKPELSDDVKAYLITPEDKEKQRVKLLKEGLTQLGSDIDAFKNTLKEWKPKTRKLKAALKGTLKKLKKFSKKYEKAMKKYEKKGVEPDLDGLNSVMADLQMKYSKDRGLLQTMDLEGDVIGGTKKSPDVVAKVASKKEKKVEEK